MSVVRMPRGAPRIVEARLTPWEPGIPGIWFRYSDGYEVNSDARVRSFEVIEAIQILSVPDQIKLRNLLEAALAFDRS